MNSSIGNISDVRRVDSGPVEISERHKEKDEAVKNLSKITDTASLSNLIPHFKGIMDTIERPDNNVLQSMSDNISNLQDAFVDTVYGAIAHEGIDFSHKMTLRLNEQERLELVSEHPEKEKLEALLGERPELSAAFREIAAQSGLLRDVNSIGRTIGTHSGASAYQNAWNIHSDASYQVSIKGEMSHFYFNR